MMKPSLVLGVLGMLVLAGAASAQDPGSPVQNVNITVDLVEPPDVLNAQPDNGSKTFLIPNGVTLNKGANAGGKSFIIFLENANGTTITDAFDPGAIWSDYLIVSTTNVTLISDPTDETSLTVDNNLVGKEVSVPEVHLTDAIDGITTYVASNGTGGSVTYRLIDGTPEPGTVALFCAGILPAGLLIRRHIKRSSRSNRGNQRQTGYGHDGP